jgi:flagellar basal-body rod modification protein FlgD
MTTIDTNTPPLLTADELPKRTPGGQMGKDEFLKLFVAQLQHQDPMNPMDDADMMGQMASFSSLEQMSNVAASNAQIVSTLSSSSAIGLIGRTVTYTDESDQTHTGVVEKVTTAGGVPSLTVSGVDGITLPTISQVA